MTCPLCFTPNWPQEKLDGLKFNLSITPACKLHAAKAEELLSGYKEPKTYVLKTDPPKKTVSDFVPKQVQVKPDWTEREPNDGSLIE